MPLPFPLVSSGDAAVAVDDSGAIVNYRAAMPLTPVGVATVPSAPTSFGPGGIPVSGGRVAYASAPVAYVSNGTPYTANHAIAFGGGPVAYYDQGMPYNAAGQLVVQGATPPITPADLFLAGELGCWLDPSDLSTMWQDSARTIPVTAAGQPVGAINDKSGRALHFTQSIAGSRPLLQQEGGRNYLDFDGVDDGLISGGVNWTAANGKVTIWAGVSMQLNQGNTGGTVIEFSNSSGGNLNCFGLLAPAGTLDGYFFRSRGAGAQDGSVTATGYPPPSKNVLCAIGDTGGDIATLRVDRTPFSNPADQGTGGYATYPFYLGRRGGTALPYKGRLYGLIMRGTVSTTAQHILDIEQWMAAKSGITLP